MLTFFRSTRLKVFGVTGFIFLATMAYAEEHAHQHGGRGAEYSLSHGKKWETDATLRQGMDIIRQALAASQEGIEKNRLSAQDYQRLANVVDSNVADIVKNCKLTKETDAAFHSTVLADLTQGTELMRTSPKLQAQRAGALGVLQSLRNYGEYFQHPGWNFGAINAR